MTITQHTMASIAASAYYYSISRSWSGALLCFLSGIFIDLDHLLDYCWRKKKMCWRLSDLKNFCFQEKEEKIYLFFHSYEIITLGWILTFLIFHQPVWIGFLFGITVHLLLDQIFNDVYPLAYFLFYRASFGFPQKVFFKEDFERDVLNKKR